MDINDYSIDQLKIGMKHEIIRKITKDDIFNFCKLSHDFHPLHFNKKYAKAAGFKDVISHGLLISSFSSCLIGMYLPGKKSIVLSQNFEYIKPVYPRDNLKFCGEIVEIRKILSIVNVTVNVINQNNEIVSKGIYRIKIRDD